MILRMTSTEYLEHQESNNGLCTSCGSIRDGFTEPDAEDYHCEDCGEDDVLGMDNALLSGYVEII